jgi:hypothetical protein
MSNQVDGKIMCVVAALRHGITTLNTPGLSVNGHSNPFFLHVIGELDLKHIAERVIQNIEQYYEAVEKGRAEAEAADASATDGR